MKALRIAITVVVAAFTLLFGMVVGRRLSLGPDTPQRDELADLMANHRAAMSTKDLESERVALEALVRFVLANPTEELRAGVRVALRASVVFCDRTDWRVPEAGKDGLKLCGDRIRRLCELQGTFPCTESHLKAAGAAFRPLASCASATPGPHLPAQYRAPSLGNEL